MASKKKAPIILAADIADTFSSRWYQAAKRQELPRAYLVGWARVKAIALLVLESGGDLQEVKRRVFELASEPLPNHAGKRPRLPACNPLVPKTPKRGGST